MMKKMMMKMNFAEVHLLRLTTNHLHKQPKPQPSWSKPQSVDTISFTSPDIYSLI